MDFNNLTQYFDLPIMNVLQGSDSLYMDRLMYIFTQPWPWIPMYAMLIIMIIKNNETLKQVLLVMGFAVLTVSIADIFVDVIVKPYFMRWRPTRDPFLKYSIDVVNGYRGGRFSFFSAHATNTMSVAMFFILLVRSRVLTVTLGLWSLLNGYTRIYMGAHFPSDVCIGFAFGAAVAAASYSLYLYFQKKITPPRDFISTQYTSSGYAYTDVYAVILVVLLIILYGVIRALFAI